MNSSTLIVTFALASLAGATDLTTLSRDSVKEAWVSRVVSGVGLSNRIWVVREPGLNGMCAYATIQGGRQYIAYDPACVTTLIPPISHSIVPSDADIQYWWSAGVMLHEIGHHLGVHMSAPAGRTTPARELEADRWAGWALRREGATLAEALVLPLRFPEQASESHPGRADRLKAIEAGWRSGAMDTSRSIGGADDGSRTPAARTDQLSKAALQALKMLRAH